MEPRYLFLGRHGVYAMRRIAAVMSVSAPFVAAVGLTNSEVRERGHSQSGPFMVRPAGL
jgi:hypothetical protein